MKSNDINIEYIEELIDYIIDEVENDEDSFVTVIAKFDEAKEVLKDVMTYENVNFESLQIESPIKDNYDDEFVLSFWMNDGVLEMGCEKLKNKNGNYTNPCADVVFLFDNCSSKIIPLCEGSSLYFVSIEDKCDCNEDCCVGCLCGCHCDDSCVEYSKTDDSGLHGFSVNKSTDNGCHRYSFYTSDILSKDDIHDILKRFGF